MLRTFRTKVYLHHSVDIHQWYCFLLPYQRQISVFQTSCHIPCLTSAWQSISLTAERNYTPIFTEAFSTQEKPLSVYLIKNKDILSENAAKSGAKQILSNLTELIRNSLKMRARVFTQEELDLKSQITDYPIIKRFEEIAGIEFDWNRFHNRREFKTYIKSLLNMKNQ